jgi:hypothetical protein
VESIEIDEGLLGYVLSLVRVRKYAVGDARNPGVLGRKQCFERLFVRLHGSISPAGLRGRLEGDAH